MSKQALGFTRVKQNAMQQMNKQQRMTAPFLATVNKVYPDRYTCDITTDGNVPMNNVPVMAECGLIGGEVYGTFDMPAVGATVIVTHMGVTGDKPIIMNYSFYPYLTNEYGKNQTAVNSGNKAETKKLLETGKSLVYRRIFKSGTTIEVGDDGTIKVETPSGSIIKMDETSDIVSVKHNNGSEIKIDADVSVKHNNGSEVKMDSTKVSVKHASGTEYEATAAGLTLKSGDATLWQPNTLPNCLFTGAPHGGVLGGIVKLKGG